MRAREGERERERELWQSHPGLHPPSTMLLRNSLDSLTSRRKPRAQLLGESAYGVTGLLREHLRLKRLVMRLSVAAANAILKVCINNLMHTKVCIKTAVM